jgi:hypothetical protein
MEETADEEGGMKPLVPGQHGSSMVEKEMADEARTPCKSKWGRVSGVLFRHNTHDQDAFHRRSVASLSASWTVTSGPTSSCQVFFFIYAFPSCA